MSNSRSPTPTPNLLPTSITLSLESSTTSRPHTHEITPPHSTGGRPQQTATRHTTPSVTPRSSTSYSHATEAFAESSSSQRRPADTSPDQPRQKRMRRDRSEERSGDTRHSSPSASSQGGLADNETEGERSQQSEMSANVAPPQKKKRTRTLTTPHQSAVLHALLAQSRFPTTAMREEVGRSIGLSARKVQIWFQNQRQKARRPRSQSATPLARPPQYGAFPNAPTSAPGNLSPSSAPAFDPGAHYVHPGGSSRIEHAYAAYPQGGSEDRGPIYREAHPSYPRSMEPQGPQLLGPGVPGSATQAQIAFPSRGRDPTMRSRPGTSHFTSPALEPSGPPYPPMHPRYSESPPGLHSVPSRHPRGSIGTFYERDFSRTLPPLIIEQPSSRSSAFPAASSSAHPSSSHSTSSSRRSIASPLGESPFAHHFPEQSSRMSLPSLAIPSPGTLQPQVFPAPAPMQPRPQWDASSYAPRSTPGMSWAGSSHEHLTGRTAPPGRGQRSSYPTFSEGEREALRSRIDTPPPRRPRRFDPVRASQMEDAGPSTSSPTQRYRDPTAQGDSNDDRTNA